MTSRIRSNRIAVKGRRFVNVSVSGAKIKHIRENVMDFYQSHEAANDVEKIILSFGTNDIKYSRRGVQHLKRYINELLSDTKRLFPDA